MLAIEETEKKLIGMLSDAGMQVDKLDLMQAFAVFKSFARLPVDTVSDGLLFQYGLDSLSYGSDLFSVSITRQFQYAGDDEYIQLALQFFYPANDLLRQIKAGNDWCFSDEACWNDFIARVQESAAFKTVQPLTPTATDIFLTSTG